MRNQNINALARQLNKLKNYLHFTSGQIAVWKLTSPLKN